MSFIENIFFIDDLTNTERQVSSKYNTRVTNISHWDTSIEFQDEMQKVLSINNNSPPWNYTYSYSISLNDRNRVMRKLGLKQNEIKNHMALLLQSGTQAILNVANLIKQYGYKNVCILRPSYFTVAYCFNLLEIKYTFEDIFFKDTITLPMNNIINKKYDCLWITSPIFSTGLFYTKQQLSQFNYLLSKGMLIITDETFCSPGYELIRFLSPCANLLSIYSPHKAISINNIKFSIIICDLKYEDFLEQWLDVLSGALSKSNCDAIFHYLSENYNYCYDIYQQYTNKNKDIVTGLLSSYSNAHIIKSSSDSGQYITVFWEGLPLSLGNDLKFFYKLINETKSSFYPGNLNGFNTNTLCFRINLTLSTAELSYSISQIAEFLSNYKI